LAAQAQANLMLESASCDTVFQNTADTTLYDSLLFAKDRELSDVIYRDTANMEAVHAVPVASDEKKFSPGSTKAVIYSAIFPGLGQIYNRKYWKLPIVYGGFMGCAYAISFNSRYYNDYMSAYLDFMDDDPATDSYRNFLPYGYKIEASNREWFSGVLKRKKDFYRRNRDLSYIVTIGLYVICMIDAYVDAELFNFDISPDLTFKVEPAFFERTAYNRRTFGLLCSFRF
jgi:hypothetical protein